MVNVHILHMDFGLTETQTQVRDEVRRFADNEIKPVASEYDRAEEFPHEVVEKASEMGLVGSNVPMEYGGAGYDYLTNVIIVEELFAADPGIGLSISAAAFGADALIGYGTDEQKEEYLRPLAAGDQISGLAVSEPEVGSDLAGM